MTSGTPKRFFPWAINLLRRWQGKHRNPKDPLAPLGLDSQQVEALRHLRQSPHWLHYKQLLETVTLNNVEQLLLALPHERYLFQCGVVFACRRLMELPDQILAKVTELEDHKNARDRINANVEDARGDIFLNTPWYDSYVRDAASRTGGNGAGTDFSALG